MISASSYTPEEPISAIATPLAPGALGIVRTSGKNVIELVAKVFSRPKALKEAKGNTLVYGWIQDLSGNKIDEVMLGVYRSPKSFTGEEMVEVFCHGGTSPVLAIQKLFLSIGFSEAQRGEFSFRAYINGKSDLTKAEAIKEIIDSKTDTSRGRAADRLSGSLSAEILEIKNLIIRTIASIEAEIEYPEDEETIADAFDSTELLKAKAMLEELSSSWASEKLYQDGAKIVLCGKTNAGKSSLFNILLKEERAIVSDIEGTTRDFIESWINFDGIPARLFDTAGLRETSDLVEKTGVERSYELTEEADLILYLIDSSTGLTKDDEQILADLPQNIPLIKVWNKADKLSETDSQGKNQTSEKDNYAISAKTGFGLAELVAAVKEKLSKQGQTTRARAGLGSERQKISCDEALASVNHAISSQELGLDAVVQDLEDALDALAELTGETSPDDILENIFSRFCVGK